MEKLILSPHRDGSMGDAYSLPEGGPGGTDIPTAVTALNALKAVELGVANGVAQLNSSALIPLAELPAGTVLPYVPYVVGQLSALVSFNNTYQISNYDQSQTYTISTPNGLISRSGDTLTFTPNAAGTVTFVVNGRTFTVTAITNPVAQPTIVSPTAGFSNAHSGILATSSAFSSQLPAVTHASSTWHLASDAAFTTILSSAVASATNKTTWFAGGLQINSTYYLRVAHIGTDGSVSAYSPTVSFTVPGILLPTAEEAKISAPDKTTTDVFGASVSLDGNGLRMAVGAQNLDINTVTAVGAVYIFVRTNNSNTWSFEAKLIATDRLSGDALGSSVALSGDGLRVIAGTVFSDPGGTTDAGAAYLWVRSGTTWTQEAKFTASDKLAIDHYGWSVTISNDGSRVAIGAPSADSTVVDCGGVYIWLRSGTIWNFEVKLVTSDKVASGYFGISVAMTPDATRLVAGAYNTAPGSVAGAGTAYVWSRSGTTWTQEAILSASDKAAQDNFGICVSITTDGTRVAIGAFQADIGGITDCGAIYVYSRSGTTWTQEQKIAPSNSVTTGNFGRLFKISPDGLRIYAGQPVSAAMYRWLRTGTSWALEATMLASDNLSTSNYGRCASISLNNERVAIGAYSANVGAITSCGAVYSYS